MGRREEPIESYGPVQRFAEQLRELRRDAGSPSYRSMAATAHYSATTLSTAASGRARPSLPVVLAYVAACGGDVADWRARWESLDAPPSPAPAPVPAPAPAPLLARAPFTASGVNKGPLLARRPVLAGLAAVAVLALALVFARADDPAAGGPTTTVPSIGARVPVDATIGSDCPPGIGTVRVNSAAQAWSVGTHGGWTGDHCLGEYYFVADPSGGDWVQWSVPLPHQPLDCLVSIFVADSPHAAGGAAYRVSQHLRGRDEPLDARTVEQSSYRGDWVGIGPYHVTGDRLAVQMSPTGPPEVTAGVIHVYCGHPGAV